MTPDQRHSKGAVGVTAVINKRRLKAQIDVSQKCKKQDRAISRSQFKSLSLSP